VKGWAVGASTTDPVSEVQIFIKDQLRGKIAPSIYRPELNAHFKDEKFLRAGWEYVCEVEDSNPDLSILVKSVSRSGREWLLYEGTIASLEAQSIAESGQQREALVRLQTELHRRLEYIRQLEAEIRRKNEALAQLEIRKTRWPWQWVQKREK